MELPPQVVCGELWCRVRSGWWGREDAVDRGGYRRLHGSHVDLSAVGAIDVVTRGGRWRHIKIGEGV
jgi:hypothetical protein